MNNKEEWVSYFTLMNGRAPSEEEIAAARSEWQDTAETPVATSQPTTTSNPQIGAAMTAGQPSQPMSSETQTNQVINNQTTAPGVQQEQTVVEPGHPAQSAARRPAPKKNGRKQKLQHKAAQAKRAHNASAQVIQQTAAQPSQEAITPAAPQQPVQPTAAQATQAPVTPQQPVQPTAAQATQAPVTPQQPVQATSPQATQAQVTPQQPVQLTAAQATQAPVTPQQPVQPTAAQATQAPVTPQQLAQPTTPQAKQAPVMPQQPVQPTAPQTTQAPVTPQQPVQPTAPQATQAPVTPQQPVQPTAPQAKQAPVTPQQPTPSNTTQPVPAQTNQMQQTSQNGLMATGQAPMQQGQPMGMQQKPDPNLLMKNYENERPFVRLIKFFSTGAWLTGRGWANAFTPGRGLGIIVTFLSLILSVFWIIVAFNAGAAAKFASTLGSEGPISNFIPKGAAGGFFGFRFTQIFAILLVVAIILFSVNYLARIVRIKGYSWIITGLLGVSFISSLWVRFVSMGGLSQATEAATKSYPLGKLLPGIAKALRGSVEMPTNYTGGTLDNAVQGLAAAASQGLNSEQIALLRSGIQGERWLAINMIIIAIITAIALGLAIFGFVKGWAKKNG